MNTKFLSSKPQNDLHIPPLAIFFCILLVAGMIKGIIFLDMRGATDLQILYFAFPMTALLLSVLFAIKVASQWEKAVVLRLGKFNGLKGAGVFWIIPIVDLIATWIDHRVMVASFSAEKTLTKDTVPVDVDAILFGMLKKMHWK
jgi:hypothetical protein